jgi:Zn-dependent protease/CBS domain-containing protein
MFAEGSSSYMRSWSILAGRLFGVDVRIHLTFVALLIFVWATQSLTLGASGAMRGLGLVTIVFICVVLHELGHALAARRAGVAVRSVILLPIGGVTLMEDLGRDANPARDIRVAVAGPVVSLALAAISLPLVLFLSPQVRLWSYPFVYAGNLPRALFWSNVFLGIFNLLPAYPMDGGRVLRAFLSQRMEYVRATRLAVSVGQGFAVLMMFAGVWNSWLMLIGFFLFVGAQLEDRSAIFQSVLESVRMEEVMLTGFSTLSPADTLEDALLKAVHTLQDDFPVVRGSDMVGVISKQGIVDALRRGGNGYVQSAMVRIFEIAQRTDSLASAFRKLGGRGLSMIPVVEHERLVGIVTMQNLMHSMALLAETRRLRRERELSS